MSAHFMGRGVLSGPAVLVAQASRLQLTSPLLFFRLSPLRLFPLFPFPLFLLCLSGTIGPVHTISYDDGVYDENLSKARWVRPSFFGNARAFVTDIELSLCVPPCNRTRQSARCV